MSSEQRDDMVIDMGWLLDIRSLLLADFGSGITTTTGTRTADLDPEDIWFQVDRLRRERERQERERFYVSEDIHDRLLAEGYSEWELRGVCKVVPGLEPGSAYQIDPDAMDRVMRSFLDVDFVLTPPPDGPETVIVASEEDR